MYVNTIIVCESNKVNILVAYHLALTLVQFWSFKMICRPAINLNTVWYIYTISVTVYVLNHLNPIWLSGVPQGSIY